MGRFSQVVVSSIVRTPALGMDADDYLNAVLSVESDLAHDQLGHWCKQLEQKLGRTRFQDGICQADLDILEPDNIREPFFRPLVHEVQSLLCGQGTRYDARKVTLKVAGIPVGQAPCRLTQVEPA